MINTQLSNKIFKKCVEFNAKEDLPEIEKNEDESDMELTDIDSDNSSVFSSSSPPVPEDLVESEDEDPIDVNQLLFGLRSNILLDSYEKILNETLHSDVSFMIEGKPLKAHKAILSSKISQVYILYLELISVPTSRPIWCFCYDVFFQRTCSKRYKGDWDNGRQLWHFQRISQICLLRKDSGFWGARFGSFEIGRQGKFKLIFKLGFNFSYLFCSITFKFWKIRPLLFWWII